MLFKKHLALEGQHAFLSASKASWIRYDHEKLIESFHKAIAARRGTELHALAASLIKMRQKLPQTRQTLCMYVNDAIGYGMEVEQPLFYSVNAFGTADSISFKMDNRTKRNRLRIHDLKTGVNEANMDQLMIYAAFFMLEYGVKPHEVDIELRIYQNDETKVFEPDPHDIVIIMDTIVEYDGIIDSLREEAAG